MEKYLFFLIMFLFIALMTFSADRGITAVNKEPDTGSGYIMAPENINTTAVFDSVIQRNMQIFLVGNNAYSKESGYPKLHFSGDDITLIKQIAINCCKIKPAGISLNHNLTLEEFKKKFQDFIHSLEKESLVLIFYSGHGSKDGSIVFTDGGKLSPPELRIFINSFSNDTILIIDACYAGKNEGPFDFSEQEESFKNNCIRIYATLAHLIAKEITYDNPFFTQSLPFYRDVLGIENSKGNGYFTALLGLFFAHYKFRKNENVTFSDMVYYITNKGRIYTETLAAAKGDERKSALEEAVYRLNQYPKIHPVDEKITLNQPDHEFIILQKSIKKYRPDDSHISFLLQTRMPITLPPFNESMDIGIMPLVSVLYNINPGWGIIGFGLQTGVQWSHTIEDAPIPFDLFTYPVTLHLRYCADLSIPFYFLFDLNTGIGINHLVYQDSYESEFSLKFFLSTGIAIGYNVSKKIGISLSLYYMWLSPYTEIYQMLAPGTNITYITKIFK